MELDEGRIVSTIKAYHDLAKVMENRSKILSDNNFLNTAAQLISDKRPRVVNRISQVLLTLTEREEDAVLLKDAQNLRSSIGSASEQMFPPILLHNLLTLSSRIHVSSETRSRKMDNNKRSRRFVHHKSLELSFILTPFNDDIRLCVEKKSVTTKGVISVSMDNDKGLVQLRITPSLAHQVIVKMLFDSGTGRVERVVKNERGNEELWEMNREDVVAPILPQYIEEVDPSKESCAVIPSDHITSNGGWISSITSYFW